MATFTIMHLFNDSVLFEIEADSFIKAVEAALKARADLQGANLRGANLRGANLRGANLRGADLRDFLSTNSVQTVLTITDWGQLPDDLTLELMRHDAESCGEEAMTVWAKGGACPFNNSVRDYKFTESHALWQPGPPTMRGRKLLEALWVSKGGRIWD